MREKQQMHFSIDRFFADDNDVVPHAIKKTVGYLINLMSWFLMIKAEKRKEENNTRMHKENIHQMEQQQNVALMTIMKYFKNSRKFNAQKINFLKFNSRCVFTNIDPDTAERNPDQEPLTTLKSYRQFEKTGESPVMGIHLGVREYGKIKLGDAVFVEDD